MNKTFTATLIKPNKDSTHVKPMSTLFSLKINTYLIGPNSSPLKINMKNLKIFLNKKSKEKNNSKEKSPTLFQTPIILMQMSIKKILPVKLPTLTKNFKISMQKKYKFFPTKLLFKSLSQPIKLNFKRIKNYWMNALKVHLYLLRHENH